MIWEWPRIHRGAIDSQFFLQSSSLSAVSPFTGQRTAYGPNFQGFVCKITFPAKQGPDWREMQGIITRLRGQVERLRMVDYYRMRSGYDQAVLNAQKLHPQSVTWSDGSLWDDESGWSSGYLPPYVEVDEFARRDDTSIVLRGFPPNIELVMRLADLFEVRPNGQRADHGHLYEVVRNVRTNADGKTRVYFEPGLRTNVVAGDQIVLRYPTSVFTLASDSEGVMTRSLGNMGAVGLSLIEKLP